MSISKLQFEQIKQTSEKLSFKELDLNNDCKIDKADEALAKDNSVKNQIHLIVDEESSIESDSAEDSDKKFNESVYLQNKMQQLNSIKYKGRDNWTVEDVKKAFKDDGFTSEQHYELYGKAEGISPTVAAKSSMNELFVLKEEQNAYKNNLDSQLLDLANQQASIDAQLKLLESADPEDPAINALKEMKEFLNFQAETLKAQQKIANEVLNKSDDVMADGKVSKLELQLVEILKKKNELASQSTQLAFADPSDPAGKQLAEAKNILDLQAAEIETAIKAGKTDKVEYSQSENDVNFKALSDVRQEQIAYKNNLEYQLEQIENKQAQISYQLMQLAFADPEDPVVSALKEANQFLEDFSVTLEAQQKLAENGTGRINEMMADGKVTELELQLAEIQNKQSKIAYDMSALKFSNPQSPELQLLSLQSQLLDKQAEDIESAIKAGRTE